MSRYALVLHNKIITTQSGEKPTTSDNWVPIVKNWQNPIDYPANFYVMASNTPILTISDNVVLETLDFSLKSVEEIKDSIAQQQKTLRQTKQLGSFEVGSLTVTLADREDSLIINGLNPDEPVSNFKIAPWTWADLSSETIVALKAAHKAHVDAAYAWERASNDELGLLVTHDELVTYLENNPEIQEILLTEFYK